jgi:hypothetical protein
VLWETLADVIYLRTGNLLEARISDPEAPPTPEPDPAATFQRGVYSRTEKEYAFLKLCRRYFNADDVGYDDPKEYAGDDHEDPEKRMSRDERPEASMLIPIQVAQAELDLEKDEARCLRESGPTSAEAQNASGRTRQRQIPPYGDHVLALRILVEAMCQLQRVDDVERVLLDGFESEIRSVVRAVQTKTFLRLEERKSVQTVRSVGKTDSLEDFRLHLRGLLSAFGSVMLRLHHLAEILHLRIVSWKKHSVGHIFPFSHSCFLSDGGRGTAREDRESF